MSDVSHTLHREIAAAKTLLANLADVIGDDAEFAADLVEGETNLHEAINRAVDLMWEDHMLVTGITEAARQLDARKNRLEARIANTRTALSAALQQAGRTTYEHELLTLTVKSVPPSAVITDEAVVPSKFWKPADPKLDKRAVLAALKAKEDVPGATLSNGGTTLQVRFS